MSTIVAELPDLYEVVNGQVVESEMSAKAIKAASELEYRLNVAGRSNNHGEAYGELLIAMPDRFEHNRRPDVCYISYAKWPKGEDFPNDNALDVVPDLCVEVVSPRFGSRLAAKPQIASNSDVESLLEKVEEYFEAGVTAVWVVYPNRQTVDCYASPTTITRLRRGDTLTGDPVIPGFAMPLAELFPIRAN
jgi:Uma2 family endonuclease